MFPPFDRISTIIYRIIIDGCNILAFGDNEAAEFLNSWIELKKRDKTIAALFYYWISGKKAHQWGRDGVSSEKCWGGGDRLTAEGHL